MVTAPLGWLWAAAARARRFVYARGLRASVHLGPATISVGNLTVGGTGKTPFCSLLMRLLDERGCGALMVSRGYGGDATSGALNDEGAMLSLRHPGHRHVQGADRVSVVRTALESDSPDVIILDDGAQHFRIRRDLDVFLVDAAGLAGPRRCLPAGPWRESPSAISRADVVVITRSDAVSDEDLERARHELAALAPRALRLTSTHRPSALIRKGVGRPPEELAGKRVGLVSGIAQPASFERTVIGLGAEVVWHLAFEDHAAYDRARRAEIERRRADVDLVITTEKDAVKLQGTDIAVLEVVLDIGGGEGELVRCLEALLSRRVRSNE